MTIQEIELSNQEYWEKFFSTGGVFPLARIRGDIPFAHGDKIHFINVDSIHSHFPFGKSYGKVQGAVEDSDILKDGKVVIYYKNFGFMYLYLAGFFGLLGICCLLSILG